MNPRDWDELAELDPYRFNVAGRDGQYKWDPLTFFMTGEVQVAEVLAHAGNLGYPAERLCALDFGCGVGRLTRALAARFERVYGVDASGAMIKLARELNAFANCRFFVSAEASLNLLGSDEFDMVYSWQVLQNTRNRAVASSIIRECVRVLKPSGLLVFQFPARLPRPLAAGRCKRLKSLLKLIGARRSQLYWPLLGLGLKREFVYTRLRLWPADVWGMPQDQVMALVQQAGARVLEIQIEPFGGIPDMNRIYWITK